MLIQHAPLNRFCHERVKPLQIAIDGDRLIAICEPLATPFFDESGVDRSQRHVEPSPEI
jgi:hypothetical protein